MGGRWRRGVLLKALYPLLMLAGAFLKGRKEGLQAFVVRLNNRLVVSEHVGARRIMVLLPHCLQVDTCTIRLTHDVRNCKQCGKCGIKDLIAVADRYGLAIHVASGGNLARRIVSDFRPDAVVAVACERDLSSGIADTYPLPVFGICNERPQGPCINTRVSIAEVEAAIETLVGAV